MPLKISYPNLESDTLTCSYTLSCDLSRADDGDPSEDEREIPATPDEASTEILEHGEGAELMAPIKVWISAILETEASGSSSRKHFIARCTWKLQWHVRLSIWPLYTSISFTPLSVKV